AEVALREQALIDARSELRARRLELARVMDAPIDAASDLEIVPVSLPAIAQAPEFDDESSRVRLALLARPDLNESRTRLEQDRLETVRTRNGLLPRLDAFVAFAKTGYAETFRESFLALDESSFDFSVGVSFSQSIGRDEARGLYEASLATRQQAAAAVRNLEQLVELEVRLALNDARRAREQIGASATTRRLQRETVDAELQRFEAGASTALLVAQAQRDLLESEINEVEALVGFRIALVRLYLAEGSLLDRRGVATTGA
ncbi:MAG: TolC family protein, partial [Planctomycetota bacterium]